MQTARLNERALFQTRVDVVPHGGPGALTVWCQDLSETGMFVQTTQAFAVGDLLSLRFEVDGAPVHIRAAEVVWVRKFEPISVDGRLPGLGLRFVSVDPPARGALRRVVQRGGKGEVVQASLSRVPKPPPVPSAATTTVTGLPEPALTLPPLSASIIEAAGGTRDLEDTQDLLPPAALQRTPPGGVSFSMLPFRALDVSLPPDEPNLSPEARVFDGVPDTPRAVTMLPAPAPRRAGPRAVTMGPTPASAVLSGPTRASGLSSGPSLASAPPRQAVTQKLFSLPPADSDAGAAPSLLPEVPARLATMSIIQSLPPASAEVRALMGDDVAPANDNDDLPAPTDEDPFAGWRFARVDVAPAAPAEVAAAAIAEGVPVAPGEIENPSILEERPEAPTLIPSLVPTTAEVSDGYSLGPAPAATTSEPPRWQAAEATVIVRQPLRDGPGFDLREERRVARPTPARRRSRLGPAVAVLALGCAAGAAVALLPPGTFGARVESTATTVSAAAPPPAAVETAVAPTPTPLPVEVAERELRPVAAAAVAAPAAEPVKEAPPATVEPATLEAAPVVAAAVATPAPTPAAEVAVAPAKAAPAKAEPAKAEPVKAAVADEPVLASSTRATRAQLGGRHEVTLPEAGRLKKVFALDAPARVVIDLEGGRLPGAAVTVGEGGVVAVRFGQPAPEVRRVVVVLDGDRKPDAVDARLDGDRLIVTWQQ